MGTFTASLRAIGDVKALPATIELDEGRLSIASGDTEIGSWQLTEINLEPTPNGYRMAAEGDQILIELEDIDSFTEALQNGSKRRLLSRGRKKHPEKATQPDPTPEETPVRPATPVSAPTRSSATRSHNVALPPAETSPAAKPEKAKGGRVVDSVDALLVRAQKRFGPYLPDWVFTRFMFGMVVLTLALMIVLPGLVSVVLLVGGLALVLFGAVVYTDPMLASRLLPGRSAPQHALLVGVLTLMVGVLLGVIAR